MARSSSSHLEPIVENSEAIIKKGRRAQRRMEEIKPTLESYSQSHHLPLCNAIHLPTGAKFELKPSIL